MDEREVKVIDVDPDTVREQLEDRGIEQKQAGEIESRFYDFQDGRIEDQGVLRLRRYGDKTFVTYKEMRSQDDVKDMKEIEFGVDDLEAVASMFEAMGLEEIRSSSKYREKYRDGDLEYVLDKYDDVPWVLEIEAPDRDQLHAAVEDLGYSMDETRTWDAAELLAAYDAD